MSFLAIHMCNWERDEDNRIVNYLMYPAMLLVAAAVMVVCGLLMKKPKFAWLGDYALPISLILGMAAAIPTTTRKSDDPTVFQKSVSADSSASLISVSGGEGNIKGLPTASDASCHSNSQNKAAEIVRPNFLSSFIYPNIPSSGILPPIEVGTCAKSAPQNSVSPLFISSPTR